MGFRKRALATGALIVAALAAAAPPAHAERLAAPVGRVVVQTGARCAIAAAVTALDGLGLALDERRLAREVALFPDGVAWLDLADALAPRGVITRVGTGGPADIATLVAAGHPVIAAVGDAGGKHAVLVTWVDRPCPSCAPTALGWLDPRDGAQRAAPADAFARRQLARQIVVLTRAPTQVAGPLGARLDAEHRRYRAREWVRRATNHPPGDPQIIALLRRAVAEDPAWDAARSLLDRATAPPAERRSPAD